MTSTKSALIAVILLIATLMSACSAKRTDEGNNKDNSGISGKDALSGDAAGIIASGAPLAREDFNFYRGSSIINADDDSVYGGVMLTEGWSTARGFKYGDDLQKFSQVYNGIPSIITVTGIESDVAYYPNAEINEIVADISAENCSEVNFVIIREGYTLIFDYIPQSKEFTVTTRSLTDNYRDQAFSLLLSIAQYQLLGPYPEIWPCTGHLTWAENVDEIEYLNARDDLLNEEEQVFVFENAETYLDTYGIPPSLDELREFHSSLGDSGKETFDSIGQKIWSWVLTNLSNEQ